MPSISRTAPTWMWLVSWGVWLVVFGLAGLQGLRVLRTHGAEMRAGEQVWQMRVEICKRLSPPPRPLWQECHARAREKTGNLVAGHGAPDAPDID